jgi:hypothetical protein
MSAMSIKGTKLEEIAHPSYLSAIRDWWMIRDCYKGSIAVKDAGSRYLPRLSGQNDSDYENYKNRALFFPITGKTASSMVGVASVKRPNTKFPDHMAEFFEDTAMPYQFTEFYMTVLNEIVLMGRYGTLIDAPAEGALDPKFVPYIAENIINWDDDGSGKITMLLLREYVTVKGLNPNKPFERSTVVRYRHCFLEMGVYKQQTLDDEMKPAGLVITPHFNGLPIDYIPFVPFGATGIHMNVDKAPMAEVATINISHYMTSADLEWGRHFAGLPTPVVSGVDNSTVLKVGGTAAWILPAAEAKAYYLEFTGQGLLSLEKAMQEKIGLMATMSARMLDSSSKGSEAAETVKLRYMSESATIITILSSVETGLNMLYNMMAVLKGLPATVKVQFSREVLGYSISFSDLKILFEAYFKGGISKETLVYNLRRLDAINPDRSDSQELAAIQDPEPPKPEGTAGAPAAPKAPKAEPPKAGE